VKFLVDMPLTPDLAELLRSLGHDAVHAAELGLHRAPDSATEPSVILFRDGNWSDAEVIDRMSAALAAAACRYRGEHHRRRANSHPPPSPAAWLNGTVNAKNGAPYGSRYRLISFDFLSPFGIGYPLVAL